MSENPNFVEYIFGIDQAEFSKDDIEYIEGMVSFLSNEDREILRRLESAKYNINTKRVFYFTIPGIRRIQGEECIYISTISGCDNSYTIKKIDKYIRKNFGNNEFMFENITIQVNGKDYVPVILWGDLEKQEGMIRNIANIFDICLAKFNGSHLVTDNGEQFRLSNLRVFDHRL